MKKAVWMLVLMVILGMMYSGCRFVRIEEEPLREVSYSLVKQEEIPDDLQTLIAEKKKKEFQLVYQMEKSLYLIKGYGWQPSGGYSIQVEQLGVSGNALIIHTKLLGPQDDEEAGGEPSYPYIVVKTDFRREPVVFR